MQVNSLLSTSPLSLYGLSQQRTADDGEVCLGLGPSARGYARTEVRHHRKSLIGTVGSRLKLGRSQGW